MTLTATLLGPAGGGNTTGSQSISGGGYSVSYSLRYICIDVAGTAGPVDVLNATGLPLFGDPFTGYGTLTDDHAFVTEGNCTLVSQGAAGNCWHIDVKFSSEFDPIYSNANPLLNQPMASWSSQKFEEIAYIDTQTGYPILNSAGEYFDPPATKDATRLMLSIVKYQSTYNYPLSQVVQDTCNLNPWAGYGAKQVKCTSVQADPPIWNPLVGRVWRATYQFELMASGQTWQLNILDAGMRQLVGGTQWEAIKDENMQPISEPALLNGSGSPLSPGTPSTLTPVFLQYDGLNVIDFSSALGIGLCDLGMGPILL